MKMEFKKPEMLISLFSPEDIVTTSLTGNAADAVGAITKIAADNNNATPQTLTADFSSLNFNMAN